MTERFIIDDKIKLDDKIETYELRAVVDNHTKNFYFIVDSLANVESFVKRLNSLCHNLETYCEGNQTIHERMKVLSDENMQLKSENQRLIDKLNQTALELVDNCISQGKASEISEMSYSEFLDYRAKNGKPMELRE